MFYYVSSTVNVTFTAEPNKTKATHNYKTNKAFNRNNIDFFLYCYLFISSAELLKILLLI